MASNGEVKPSKNPVGPPRGSQNHKTHGLVALQSGIKRRVRRGRDRIDKRTNEGKEALSMRAGAIADRGGLDNLSTVELGVVVAYSEAWWLRAMVVRSIAAYLKKKPHLRDNPHALRTLFEMADRADSKVIDYSKLLGLEKKPPPQKSLEQILNEDEPKETGG